MSIWDAAEFIFAKHFQFQTIAELHLNLPANKLRSGAR